MWICRPWCPSYNPSAASAFRNCGGVQLLQRPEVSPIKCDVRECVVRTSDSRECVIRMRNCRYNGRFYVLMADFTMGNGTFYRNGGKFWRMWRSNDTFSRIWRSNDTFSNVTFYRRDLIIGLLIWATDPNRKNLMLNTPFGSFSLLPQMQGCKET